VFLSLFLSLRKVIERTKKNNNYNKEKENEGFCFFFYLMSWLSFSFLNIF
jgi:hypothetical protein